MSIKNLDLSIVLSGGAQLYVLMLEQNTNVLGNMLPDGNNKLKGTIPVNDLGDGGPYEHYMAYEFRGPNDASISLYGTFIDADGNTKVIIAERDIPLDIQHGPMQGIGASVIFFSI